MHHSLLPACPLRGKIKVVKLNYRLGSCWQTLERKILAGISRKEAVADSGAKAGISETLDPHSDVQALKPEVAAHIWWFSFHLAQAATAGLNLCSLEWAQVEWNRGGTPELYNGEFTCVLVKLSQGLIHSHWQKQASGWEWIDFRRALGFPSAWWGQPMLPGSVGSQQSLRQAQAKETGSCWGECSASAHFTPKPRVQATGHELAKATQPFSCWRPENQQGAGAAQGDTATSHGAVVSEVICQRLLGLQPHQTFWWCIAPPLQHISLVCWWFIRC